MKNLTQLAWISAVLIAAGGVFFLLPGKQDGPRNAPSAAPDPARTERDVTAPVRAGDEVYRPSAALRARLDGARRLGSIEARHAAIVAALADAAEAEPAAAAALAVELGPLEGRDEALHETIGHFLRADPGRAFAFLHECAARVDAETTLVLAREAAAFDPTLARALAERLPQPLRSSAMSDTFSAWTAVDARAASSEAAQLEDEHDRVAAAAAVARVWAHDDPRAAFAWGGQFEDLETRGAALEPTIATWAESDPLAAAQTAAGAHGDGRQRLLDAAAGVWAGSDPDAALAWIARALRDPAEREATAATVLLQVAEAQPALAAERAASWAEAAPAGAQSPVLDKVLSAFSARTPAEAAAWAHARPGDAPLHDAVASSALARWEQQDASAAESWRRTHAPR